MFQFSCAFSINIFLWAVVLLCHAACKSFGSLLAVRFLLGMCEGAITPGFLIVTSMFYTHAEKTRRVGYWCKLWFICLFSISFCLSFDERFCCDYFGFHQFWPSSHEYNLLHALAMVSYAILHDAGQYLTGCMRLMIITGTITLITSMLFWCVCMIIA
jgi:ACS family allantoate permease-like MFS transporter